MSQEAVVVVSLHAKRVQQSLGVALAALDDRGIQVANIFMLRRVGDVGAARDFAQAHGIRLIIAAGGDGTVGSVANAIACSTMMLGVLPLGTSNDFARAAGLPLDIDDACAAIAAGRTRRLDLGLVTDARGNKRYFVHAAIVGVNSRFSRLATAPEWRRRYGPFAYPLAAIHAMRTREIVRVRIDADGRRIHGGVLQVSVLNAPLFGGALDLRVPEATLVDRRLDLVIVGDLSPRKVLWALADAMRGRRRRHLALVSHPARIRMETDKPHDLSLDGEIVAQTPVTIESAGEALLLVGPF